MKQIICRQDSTRQQVVFLLDTLNNDNDTLQVWKGTPDQKTDIVPIDYYKSTKPLVDKEELDLTKKFVTQFSVNDGIIVRRRLYKSAPVKGSGGIATFDEHFDKKQFAETLITGLSQAVRQAVGV
jgi:hypothetical protein